ncbi:MAG: hypothetical protein FJ147_04905 [Deltaproteobacteria bacterium]|nr:hypothetical protein [Deltaproteobacteria bacterium]
MNVITKDVFTSLALHDQVARLGQVDAKTRQDLILSSRYSLDLVRLLSPEMLFYTIKEIGLVDAVGLLALASPDQVRDMMDLDCWRKDHLDEQRTLTWLMLLDESGSGKLAQWALRADVELLVLLIRRHFEIVRKADIEEDPDFNQSLYFTFDDQYLLRFMGDEEPILHLLLERIRVLDYRLYTYILENCLMELDSSLEEGAFRWRTARLADRAYPDYEEAQALFRVVVPESIGRERFPRIGGHPLRFAEGEALIPSDHALMLLDVANSFFLRALDQLSPDVVEALSHDLAVLTNQVVIAEGADPGEVSDVRRCVELAHDCLNIGLEYLAKGDERQAVYLLHETMLRPFFQIGRSVTLRLGQQAREVARDLQHRIGEPWVGLVDSPFREATAGAQRRQPLFFRGLETPGEILFRPFRSLTDVVRVEALLAQVPVWFSVFAKLELLPQEAEFEQVSLAVLWNTMFARWVVTQNVDIKPLRRRDLNTLQRKLRGSQLDTQRVAFQRFVADHCQLSPQESQALHTLAEHALEKLHEALTVDAMTIELRFIEGLLMEE